MLGGPAWSGMRSGKSSSLARRPSFFACCGWPALRAGMAEPRSAAKGGPQVRPSSCRLPDARCARARLHCATARNRGRRRGRMGRSGPAAPL
eukprot:5933672-Lingulodinium_polyedra.AAC.1